MQIFWQAFGTPAPNYPANKERRTKNEDESRQISQPTLSHGESAPDTGDVGKVRYGGGGDCFTPGAGLSLTGLRLDLKGPGANRWVLELHPAGKQSTTED